jgi:carboxylesterase type B
LGDRYRLADLTMKTWAAFARAGDPSTPGLKWAPYDLNSRATMFLDRSPHLVNDPQSDVRQAVLDL